MKTSSFWSRSARWAGFETFVYRFTTNSRQLVSFPIIALDTINDTPVLDPDYHSLDAPSSQVMLVTRGVLGHPFDFL